MRVVVTNISPNPLPVIAAPAWWTICTSCDQDEAEPFPIGSAWTIESENEQTALDYAFNHWRLAHRGQPMAITIESQIHLDMDAQVSR